MSRESSKSLNRNVLIGMTSERGHAWHYKMSDQGAEPNHYDRFVPVADINRRLFSWEAVSMPSGMLVPSDITEDGAFIGPDGTMVRWVAVEGQQHIVRSDNLMRLGTFTDGYTPHQYSEWLLGVSSNILGDSLGVTSAGLLKGGRIAWVEVSVPETMHTPEGVDYRPNLLAGTSFDGSVATFFKRTATATVCDNTFAIARAEVGQVYKLKHTKNSGLKITDARQALNLINGMADDFAAQVKELCATTVTDRQWFAFLESIAPTEGKDKGRGLTMAQNKQDALRQLWNHDERVSPWKNTAFAVVQATNTYDSHIGIVRNTERAERNMLNVVTGLQGKADDDTLTVLGKILINV